LAEVAGEYDWVGYLFLVPGFGVFAAGAVLLQAGGQPTISVFPFGMLIGGILAASFGGFWLLASRRERPGFARIVTGPRRPDPPPP